METQTPGVKDRPRDSGKQSVFDPGYSGTSRPGTRDGRGGGREYGVGRGRSLGRGGARDDSRGGVDNFWEREWGKGQRESFTTLRIEGTGKVEGVGTQ